MKTQSIDTHPEAEKFQISLIQKASVAKRLQRMRSLYWNETEVNLAFVRTHYGDELADAVTEYLKNQK